MMAPQSGLGLVAKVTSNIPVAPLVLIVLYLIIARAFVPELLSWSNVFSILFSTSVLLPAVLGMQALVSVGKFDLSQGSSAAMAGVVCGLTLVQTKSIHLAMLAGVFAAGLAGIITGVLVAWAGMDVLVVTLAMMGILRSISLGIANGQTVSGFPNDFEALSHGQTMGLDTLVLAAAVLLIVCDLFFRYHVHFRHMVAIGSNPRAARSAGIPVRSVVVSAFVLATLGAASTGLVQASRSLSASPLIFQDLPIDAIAACIIGGSSLRGGRGTMVGAALGLMVVVATRNLVVALDGSVYWRYMVIGCIILLVSLPDALTRRSLPVEQR